MGDKETFKLLLLFHGNGYNPEIISRWILLAQSWTSSQATAEKRARQIQFVRGLSCKIRSAMYRSSVPYYSRSAGQIPQQVQGDQQMITPEALNLCHLWFIHL